MLKNKIQPEIYSTLNHKNKKRRVGFELEYFGISIEHTADLLQDLFGGEIIKKHKNLMLLSNSELGSFKIELDAEPLKKLTQRSQRKQRKDAFDWEGMIENVITSSLKGIIPIEIVTPPILIDHINRIDNIIEKLRETAAYDTKESLLTAFGLHINPDIPSANPAVILAFMQAYILLNDWMKLKMSLDLTRQLSGFIKDFPDAYCQKILDQEYKPDLDELINDYIRYNPSRNRALDMLPLLSYLKNDGVLDNYNTNKIKPRPAFHYRLPNSSFSEPDWNFSKEWQRWLYIEALAKQDELRKIMIQDYLSSSSSEWLKKIEDYIDL